MHRELSIALMTLVAAGAVFAQISGRITGTVRDPSGAVVAGAAVTAVNSATGAKQMAVTNGQGTYFFQAPLIPV